MSKFALNTALPRYLRVEQDRVEKIARGYGLDFFPTIFEILKYDQMNEIAAYGGFPSRYPHWRFGMEYEQLAKSYEYGLSKIYEMVINNNPSYAYLLEGNSLTEQKLVMSHVLGHVDFFKNNFCFRATDLDAPRPILDPMKRRDAYEPDRRWIDKLANHGSRVGRHVERHGINKVESFVDHCLSLENLIDPWSPFSGRQPKDEDPDDDRPLDVPKLQAKEYMEDFINPREYLESQKKKLETQKTADRKFPARPERDVLKFLLDHAPLERWERDVLEVIRDEAYYFVPQRQTKVMNEGWACLAAGSYVFTDRGLLTMKALIEARALRREKASVSDGAATRLVYDQHVIRGHATVTVKTRRGLTLTGSNNHRVLAPDGVTWRRLDELEVGSRVKISGGAGLWASEEVALSYRPAERVTLDDVALAAGVSVSTVIRARRAGRYSDELASALVAYETPENAANRKLGSKRKCVKLPDTVSPELGAFLGYLVGDGHISRVKRTLGVTTADEPMASHFANLANHLFDLPAVMRWDASSKNGRWRVSLHSETVSDFLVEALGLTTGPSARFKVVPEAVLRSPAPVVREFLRAYFDCDAYAGKQGVILSTMSEKLGEQVQLLLLNFGVLSRRRRQKDGAFHVHVSGSAVRQFLATVGFGLGRKKEACERYLREHAWFKEESWEDEVVSLENGRADVYDISVEETHRYAACGFVNHNSYWHSRIMTEKLLDASEIIDYADANAGVMAMAPGKFNPYKIGVELYRYVEDRWNKGQFGKEWEECDDIDERRNWDMKLGLGRKKVFEVRALYNDVTFIDEFLTPEFIIQQKLYTFGFSSRNDRYEIESRQFREVKEKLLFHLTNFGDPYIRVIDANYANRGELLLAHDHMGVDLRQDYAKETLQALVRVWKRPVALTTKIEQKAVMVRYDGTEHSIAPFRV